MSRQDLLELYQLLKLFRNTYQDSTEKSLDGWMESVAEKFAECTCGEDARKAHNPRNAGKKRVYTEEQDAEIVRIRQEGKTIRETAALTHASIGHVQDVLRRASSL